LYAKLQDNILQMTCIIFNYMNTLSWCVDGGADVLHLYKVCIWTIQNILRLSAYTLTTFSKLVEYCHHET